MRLTQSSKQRERRRSQGQSLVELALILPVMLLFMLTALDLGRVLYSQITVTNAAKEGALVASQGGAFQSAPCSDTNPVMCGVLTEAEGGFVEVDPNQVSMSGVCEKNAMWPASGGPPVVTVTVQAPFQVLTPVIGDLIGTNLVLTATADAQCLVVPRVIYPSVPEPVAAFTANPTSGSAPLTVNVDALASYSSGSTITGYAWNFGGSGAVTSTTYNSAGTFTITLTVTDNRGRTDTESQTITVTGGGGGPTCPTVSFTATDDSNPGNPHRMDLAATLSDGSSGWTGWAWSGAITETGVSPNNVDFPSTGQHSVTVTATKATCVVSATQIVTAP